MTPTLLESVSTILPPVSVMKTAVQSSSDSLTVEGLTNFGLRREWHRESERVESKGEGESEGQTDGPTDGADAEAGSESQTEADSEPSYWRR